MESLYKAIAEPSARQFIPIGAEARPGIRARVVTYNVLADAYLVLPGRQQRYCNDLTGVAPEHVAWESRLPRVLNELESYNADIICMQEVERDAFSRDFVPGLARLGYLGVGYADRDSDEAVAAMPPGNRSNGVAIFCRPATFGVLATRSVLFAEEVDRLMPEASGELRGRIDGSLNPNGEGGFNTSGQGVALLAVLKHKRTGKQVVVCSTHLYFDFRFNDTKSAQALMLHRAVDAFISAEVSGIAPHVIICGDFNSMPEGFVASKLIDEAKKSTNMEKEPPAAGGAYCFFRTGRLETTHPDHPDAVGSCKPPMTKEMLSPLTPMLSAYAQAGGPDAEPECTSRDVYYSACLDYIWIGSSKSADTDGRIDTHATPQIVELLQIPYERGTAVSFGPIPDSQWPSDHLALGATLVL